MSTSVICSPQTIEGLIIRVIELTSCGVPVSGSSGAVIVMDGFTKVLNSPQYATGTRVTTRKANATLCLNHKTKDQFTHAEVTVDFCGINPGIPVLMATARLITATQSPTGTGFAIGTAGNADPAHFSLELWQPPPQNCESATVYYPYWAWPHLSDGKLGQMEFSADNPTVLQIMANTYPASVQWTAGNAYLGSAPAAGDGFLYNLQSTAPPPSACTIAEYP